MTTQAGILYKLKNGESTVALDFTADPTFVVTSGLTGNQPELRSVASNEDYLYISYISLDEATQKNYFKVDEYSKTFSKIRTVFSNRS